MRAKIVLCSLPPDKDLVIRAALQDLFARDWFLDEIIINGQRKTQIQEIQVKVRICYADRARGEYYRTKRNFKSPQYITFHLCRFVLRKLGLLNMV